MRDIHTTLMGNATADPTVRRFEDGSTSTLLRIAVTGSYFDNDKGDFVDRKTEFINVFSRRALGRNVASSVRKGQPVIVSGRLGSNEWTTDNGERRFTLTMQAEAIGHNLSYGSSSFVKPLRAEDSPEVDHQTGEIDPQSFVSDADITELLTSSDAEDVDDSLTAS